MTKKKKILDIAPTPATLPSGAIAPIMQPELVLLYSNRLARLQALAQQHAAMHDYLLFASEIVKAQEKLLKSQALQPQTLSEPLLVDWGKPPLLKTSYQRNSYWREVLEAILKHFDTIGLYTDQPIMQTVSRVRAMTDQVKESAASDLLAGHIATVGSDAAPFFWAALSLYWAQLARQRPLEVHERIGAKRHVCPICGSAPIASVITGGQEIDGLRYLHCNLCESEWHYVRAQCSNCESSGKLNYWALDDVEAQVKTESCDDCHSHLKILYLNKNPRLDPVADDLDSLALDVLMEEKGFSRSTVNPFFFPAE